MPIKKSLVRSAVYILILLLVTACSAGKPVKHEQLYLAAEISSEYSEGDGTQIDIDVYSSKDANNNIASLVFMPPPVSSDKTIQQETGSSFYIVFAFHSEIAPLNIDPSKFGLSFIKKNLFIYPGGSYGTFPAEIAPDTDGPLSIRARPCAFNSSYKRLHNEIEREGLFEIPEGNWSCIALKYGIPAPAPDEEFYLYIDGVFSNREKVDVPLVKFRQGRLF